MVVEGILIKPVGRLLLFLGAVIVLLGVQAMATGVVSCKAHSCCEEQTGVPDDAPFQGKDSAPCGHVACHHSPAALPPVMLLLSTPSGTGTAWFFADEKCPDGPPAAILLPPRLT